MRSLIVWFCFPIGIVLAQQALSTQAHAQTSSATLDRMVAAGKSPKELAEHLFQTQGCQGCHTMGHDGKLGFTEKGKQRAAGFEGCIRMLTAMTVVVQVPEEKRSAQQRDRAARFEEFGCTTCHKVAPGKLALTDFGSKLAHLHLGCVDVEKLVSTSDGQQK